MIYKIESPAKINLHLEILDKLENGYHNINSIFQMISFCDTMYFELTSDDNCIIEGFDFPSEKNIIYRAWELYCEFLKQKIGLRIKVKKRIPEGAGLGGGSSNAASTLRFLNKITESTVNKKNLCLMAEQIGADVPFFLETTTAIVTGIGEIIEPINNKLKDISVLVINPGFSKNTAQAFKELDDSRNFDSIKKKFNSIQLYEEFEKSIDKWTFFNSFYSVYKKNSDEYREIGEKLKSYEADFWTMSGSGSSFIMLFSSKKKANQCLNDIKLIFPHSYLVFPLDSLAQFIVI